MEYLKELKDVLCRELKEIAKKGDVSISTLEKIHKLTDTIKNIDKIEMFEEDDGYSERRYSRAGDWEARGNFGRGSSYRHMADRYDDEGASYANRRGTHYVRGHYSRDDVKDHMMKQLEGMMEDADSPKEREALKECMRSLERA